MIKKLSLGSFAGQMLAGPSVYTAENLDPQLRERARRAVDKDSNAWWEDKPELVTAWTVVPLEHVSK